MKLSQALNLAGKCDSHEGEPFAVYLACGFTPQHLRTFLCAHLAQRLPDRRIEIAEGHFGDLAGGLAALERDLHCHAVALVLEWSDLDPRLGYRTTHAWRPGGVPDFPATVEARLAQLQDLIERLSRRVSICLVLPTLPLPPVFLGPTRHGDPVGFTLQRDVMAFAAAAAAMPGVRVVNPQAVDGLSPLDRRLDLSSDIRAGFPYTLEHAAVLGRLAAELIRPEVRKKGIITDLDDTLWRGILGEEGVEGVSWDLARGTHAHGLYQEMLASLAEIGVLVAVASKNDPERVEQALRRKDLVLPRAAIFPIQAGWGPKSQSVQRILELWNIGADSVVFVDDSPLELAEVANAFPAIHGIAFPAKDDRAIPGLLRELRDLFGKALVTQEDRLRLESLRAGAQRAEALSGTTPDDFLAASSAEVHFSFDHPDDRSFELINKTNQFNLNGRRLDDAAWRAMTSDPERFLLSISYRDKFGQLGRIAEVSGLRGGGELRVDTWVMSCRAFSRRIEYHAMNLLFEHFKVESLQLDYLPTDRNGPVREFLAALDLPVAAGPCRVGKAAFRAACPNLHAKESFE